MILRCTALILSLAFAGAPIVADYCAVSCESAPVAGATVSTAHSGHHHHNSTARYSISKRPQPCGHDHHGVLAVAPASDGTHVNPLTAASVALLPSSLLPISLWTSVSDLHSSVSPPGPARRGFASPIRI